MKYEFVIREIMSGTVTVEADSLDDAFDTIKRLYEEEDFTADNLSDVEFECVGIEVEEKK